MTDSEFDDEFRFLQGDADRVGHSGPLPEVERVSVAVADGRTVSALRYEPALPPQFVFLHGMGLNAHGYDPVALALGAPALALDLPGHGRSDWRDDANYSPDLLAADVVTALESLAPEAFTLVGHSLGGLTAAAVSPHVANRLHGLVLIDITPGVKPQRDASSISEFINGQRQFDTLEQMVDRAVAFGIGSDRAALTRGVALNTRRNADGKWEWAHHFAHMPPAPAQSLSEDDAPPFAPLWAPLEELHANAVAVSLIRGSEGMVSDALLDEWLAHLPQSRVTTVAGPHNLHEANPGELAKALKQF